MARRQRIRIPYSQPRLAKGARDATFAALAPEIREGIEEIARVEQRSVSWVMAEIVAMFFGLNVLGLPLTRQKRAQPVLPTSITRRITVMDGEDERTATRH
jgi:hypothetical protein